MRKLIAMAAMALAGLVASPLQAADLPYYPNPEIPEVDYGLGGSFYLRGSIGANALWSKENLYYCPPGPGSCGDTIVSEEFEDSGYGYSFGAGFGYETGTGLRADVTVDRINNEGLTNGIQELKLRSTLALANLYYDFGFSGSSAAGGGFGAYVGAGLGAAHNTISTDPIEYDEEGSTYTAAGALMAGVTYDMGSMVADLGYRMVYMPQLSNGDAAMGSAQGPYYVNDNFIHEVRGTLRYRFN